MKALKGTECYDYFTPKLTHMDPLLTCLSIFEYGFDFAEIFESKVRIFDSAVSAKSKFRLR